MLPIISARNIGKRYALGGPGVRYKTIRETVSALPRLLTGRKDGPAEEFWALRAINFDVQPGEAVGVIGRNGAGKSTLLKVLSRITAPTVGEVTLRGRLASLLEVGTGFHPELSGRENIFLNGAIMGMKRAEIQARFDEIVAFAEIDRFLDTPVKRYSSGMYVRLAFAVAAHLQPEVLVVDEVLAVGDSAFQKKCLGKMQDVASGGRTVLFVSHNMAAITRLCSRAILLQQGGVVADGPVQKVVSTYVGGKIGETPTEATFAEGRFPGSDDVRMLAARVTSDVMEAAVVDIRKPIRIEIDYEVLRERLAIHPNFMLQNDEGQIVFASSDAYLPENRQPRPPGRYRAVAEIPGNYLAEGWFSLDVAISTMEPVIVHCWERGLLAFHVSDTTDGDSVRGTYGGPFPGVVRPLLRWTTVPLADEQRASRAQ